jgi:hypothetical protein
MFSAASRGEARVVAADNVQHGGSHAQDDGTAQQQGHLVGEDGAVYEL